ncbi:MAG: ACT domain-containing protein [Aestuariibacter sp.]|nr:ACT domain-containing protein [Aestuariibacter sp.]
MRAHTGGYYVALDLVDRPGAVASIARTFADHEISIQSIVQRAPASASGAQPAIAPFYLITHDTLEKSMRETLATIEKQGQVASKPRMIRIER